jgi:hypothetical protein
MTKAAAIRKLHEIADHHLLGSGGWPASEQSLSAIFRTIRDLGLDEEVHDGRGTTRSTPLGKEVSVDLMTLFAGCWELSEIPSMLVDRGYLNWKEAEELCALPSSDFERRLRLVVVRAYLDFCNHSIRSEGQGTNRAAHAG